MRVACFMSGSGTNTRKIIEHSLKKGSEYKVVLIFSDVRDNRLLRNDEKMCLALDIAKEHSIAYDFVDIRDFYHSKGHKTRRDLSLRPEFDLMVLKKLKTHNIDIIANAGYMSIITEPLLEVYEGRILNVHPADLSILEEDKRKYVGMHAVRDAIFAGEKELRSSTHVVRKKVDYGEILVISKPVNIILPEGIDLDTLNRKKELKRQVVREHQNMLKEKGDWIIYPLTLRMIAEGRFGLDGAGGVYIDGVKALYGFRL